MFLYSIIVVAVVALTSTALIYVLKLQKLLNLSVLLAMGVSTVTVGILFPLIWSTLMNWSTDSSAPLQLGVLGAFLLTLFLYLTLLLVLTVLISSFVTDKKLLDMIEKLEGSAAAKAVSAIRSRYAAHPFHLHSRETKPVEEKSETFPETTWLDEPAISSEAPVEGKNILEKSVDTEENLDTMGVEYCSNIAAISGEKQQNEQIQQEEPLQTAPIMAETHEAVEITEELQEAQEFQDSAEESLLDVAAVTVENECSLHDAYFIEETALRETVDGQNPDLPSSLEEVAFSFSTESLPVEVEAATAADLYQQLDSQPDTGIGYYIDQAFSLKEGGDLEGALLCYMEALDKQPEDELVFWIILDTCVIYKSLGQGELAKDILQSYMGRYGHVMSDAIREEIVRNL